GLPGLVGASLDPAGDQLAEVAAHRPVRHCGALDVVLRALEPELAGPLADRPRGAPVAVKRHPDAAGVHQRRPVRPGPRELLVAVPEDHDPVADTREHPRLALLGPRGEALDVRQWGAVDVEDTVDLRPLRERVQPVDLLL